MLAAQFKPRRSPTPSTANSTLPFSWERECGRTSSRTRLSFRTSRPRPCSMCSACNRSTVCVKHEPLSCNGSQPRRSSARRGSGRRHGNEVHTCPYDVPGGLDPTHLATEIKVISVGTGSPVLHELIPQYERQSGNKVQVNVGNPAV